MRGNGWSTTSPLFDCPDAQLVETYYFRWWTFRKHIKQTPVGLVVTEFLAPVRHAGPYNTISCAFGHHLAEGSWLRDHRLLDEYTRFWFRSGKDGRGGPHFHKFSSWAAAAIRDRYLVTGDRPFVVDLLDDLVADFELWESERLGPDGLFWQFDVADGMEESISGSRTRKNIRPTINSYMAANAGAIAYIARLANRPTVADRFAVKADELRYKVNRQTLGLGRKVFQGPPRGWNSFEREKKSVSFRGCSTLLNPSMPRPGANQGSVWFPCPPWPNHRGTPPSRFPHTRYGHL